MSELTNYTIEKGDPDPRGYSVVGSDGHRIGTVADLLVDTTAMKVRQLIVDVNSDDDARGGSLIALDVNSVDVRNGTRDVLARGHAGAAFDMSSAQRDAGTATYSGDRTSGREEERLTRTEEELRIGKREVSRGEVRVGKHVEVEHVSEPVTRRREEVVIERRPIEAGARADAATIGDAKSASQRWKKK